MNSHQPEEFRYGVYARKSSEHEDAQIQSIQRQIDELVELIDRDGLRIHQEVLQESRSAFHPGRDEFSKLVRWTQEGKVNAWLCWHANRLSRNPVDAGTVVYLMDQGKLHHIRTRDRIYYNTPSDKFMLQMEFTMSKKDSDDKSTLVKSGILRRHRRGYPNGHPPCGYRVVTSTRESGGSYWQADRHRLDKVRKVLLRFLEGRDSVRTISTYARKIGLTTLKHTRIGGKPLSRSAVHSRLLMNPVYAGFFRGIDGNEYTLDETLPRAITVEQHYRILELLGSRNATRGPRRRRATAYRGLIRGPHGEIVGADFKFQVICDCKRKFSYLNKSHCPACHKRLSGLLNPNYLRYTYYSIVSHRRDKSTRATSVEERKIDDFVIREIARPMAISKELRDWAIRHLSELRDHELKDRRAEARMAKEKERSVAQKRGRLRKLLIEGVLSQEDYLLEMREVDRESEAKSEATFVVRQDWLQEAKDILNLAVELEMVIAHGSPEDKNQALKRVCSNLIWDGEKLMINKTRKANVLIETLNLAKLKNPMFEPEKCIDTKGSNGIFNEVCPTLSQGVDRLRT